MSEEVKLNETDTEVLKSVATEEEIARMREQVQQWAKMVRPVNKPLYLIKADARKKKVRKENKQKRAQHRKRNK